MASALIPLANLTLASTQATITFSSISGLYKDLMLVMSCTSSSATASNIQLKYNGDTGNNYSNVMFEGNGTTTAASSDSTYGSTRLSSGWAQINNTTIATCIVHLLDYSSTTKHKSIISRADNAGIVTGAIGSKWANTSAITSIAINIGSGTTFAAGSTFALYGVTA